MKKYDHSTIEAKWQKYWEEESVFAASDFSSKPKKYILVEFPYPSGAGLHMGHLRPYVAADVYSRFSRLKGFETLFPIGWDAFGLPAENYAIKMGVHPTKTTGQNIRNAKRQLQSWGLSFDWSREINTTDPEYYKWTQWLFLQFYKQGLAYESTGLINWCPKDKTGLANEEVIDGKCERCGTQVEKKNLRQWYLRITQYAEKLLEGLKELPEWPEPVKLQQENWIGKSAGAEIEFILTQPKVKRFVILHGREGSPTANFIPWLRGEIEKRGYEVQVPELPNSQNPDDLEQAEYVKQHCVIDEETVVLGHSFGGVVALRLLEMGLKMNRAVLIATPFSGTYLDGDERPTITSALKKGFDFEKIRDNCLGFTLLYDLQDDVVPLSDSKGYEEGLGVEALKANAKDTHFCASEEPDVLSVAIGRIKVFTTRPDTIFGATYVVLAPEHPIAVALAPHVENSEDVLKYIENAKEKSEIDRTAEGKTKTGVELAGITVINPATGDKIPLWVADYVLGHYGTGAVMAVPAHDERDFAFAKEHNLQIMQVVDSGEEVIDHAISAPGKLIYSGAFTGQDSEAALVAMAEQYGTLKTQYKLRDWVFSRQRYWGEPIPIIHCPSCGVVPVPEKDLPVQLPQVKKYEPTGTGESPLASIDEWVHVPCPACGENAKRETNTMPQWAGSSWYWLRYADVHNAESFAGIKKLSYWTPVDVYFGGMEHTTLHLLYSRFWNLFLYDQGLVSAKEPYKLRKPHGIILGPDGEKMSKSRGNVVNPDDIVKKHGADTLRMYELFLGPHEAMVSWNDQGILGVRRFLERLWGWVHVASNGDTQVHSSELTERALNKLIKKITEDLEQFHFNTCISAFMEFHNEIKNEAISLDSIKKVLILLYPFAPHVMEELNQVISKSSDQVIVRSLQFEEWPQVDESKIVESTSEVVIQVNGKVKGKVTIPFGSTEEAVTAEAVKIPVVTEMLKGETVKRSVYVPNKLLNLVV